MITCSLNTRTCCKVHIHQVHSSTIIYTILCYSTLKNNWTTNTSEPPEYISLLCMSSTQKKKKHSYAIAEITVMIMHFVRLFIATPLYAVQYRTMLSRSGSDRNFIDPSIPQENRLCSGPMATCVTPEVEPMFLKNVLLLCSPGKLTTS